VLIKVFEPKRDEVRGSWRKFYNERVHNFCSSPDIIRGTMRIILVGYVERIREVTNERRGVMSCQGNVYIKRRFLKTGMTRANTP
jgi:hypothetical protein